MAAQPHNVLPNLERDDGISFKKEETSSSRVAVMFAATAEYQPVYSSGRTGLNPLFRGAHLRTFGFRQQRLELIGREFNRGKVNASGLGVPQFLRQEHFVPSGSDRDATR